MNPNAVFSATLVTSLLLWYPSMQACLRGDLDLTPAALRYVAALTAARLAMNFLARLVNTYTAPEQADPPPPATDSQEGPGDGAAMPGSPADFDPSAGTPHRRRSDRTPEGDVDPASLAA